MIEASRPISPERLAVIRDSWRELPPMMSKAKLAIRVVAARVVIEELLAAVDVLQSGDCVVCAKHSDWLHPDEALKLMQERNDMAMLIRRLARKLPSDPLSAKALEYLVRKGLQGSCLRESN